MKLLIGIILFLVSNHLMAFTWTDLWLTADQQAQKMMQKKHFRDAIKTFERPDWSATAAYRAGEYAQSAQSFSDLNTSDGFYNQGNALAHIGKYEEAIKAYDKAIAIDTNNHDAIYNRKLIEDLLKKEQDQQNKDQQNQDQKNQDQQNKDQQNEDQKNQDQQNKDQQNQDQKNQDQQNKDQQNQDQKNQDQKNQDQQNKDQQNQDQKNQDQQNKDQQSQDQKNEDQQNKNQQNQDKQNSEEEARAKQEQARAKEQWLELVPDDPGGLMRQKFLRDYLRGRRGWYQ